MTLIDWFDVLDQENRPVLTEREILRNLQAIIADADQLPVYEVGILVPRITLSPFTDDHVIIVGRAELYWCALDREPESLVIPSQVAHQEQEQRVLS